MTEPNQKPTEIRKFPYMLPYPGGDAMYAFNQRWQRGPRDVDEMIAREADDRYHALKDDGRLER